MGLAQDSITLFKRELFIFKANLRTNIIRSLIFPLVIIVFFGNIGTSIRNVPIAVVNYANNAQSLQFLNSLQAEQTLYIISSTNEQSALSQLQLGNVQLVVVILPNFPSQKSDVPGVQVYYSNTQPTVISGVLPIITSDAQHFGGVSTAGSIAELSASSSSQPVQKTSSEISSNALYSTTSNYLTFLTGGLLAMVVVFSALFAGGVAYLSDKQLGIIKAFLITPINKNAIVISRMLISSLQGLIAAVIALLIGMALGVTLAMGITAVLYIVVVVVIIGLGFGALSMIVASKVKRVDAYTIFAQAVGLPLWFISGGITPVESLPSWLAPISAIDPLTYATNINRAVIMQGFISTGQLVTDMSILLIFTGILTLLAFKTFKPTIE